ncbi:MAG TPA: RNA-binding S4 domain-containing protein [Acidobacteriaceae bacterium]|nr:RNA-binding S4 domain-containing protein [Acidobacteriaceae bacterium]
MDTVRIDKWLWAARFFKTRALAADSCDMGRVTSNDHVAKPAREVRVGDLLRVKNESGEFVVEVLGLSSVRGPAAAAQQLYRETETSKAARAKAEEERKVMAAYDLASGRPTKQDRRKINKLRGRIIGF